jgi:hypothetical protein
MSQYGQGQGYGQYGQAQQQQQQVRARTISATSAAAEDEADTLLKNGLQMSAGLHRCWLPTARLSAGKSRTIHQQGSCNACCLVLLLPCMLRLFNMHAGFDIKCVLDGTLRAV